MKIKKNKRPATDLKLLTSALKKSTERTKLTIIFLKAATHEKNLMELIIKAVDNCGPVARRRLWDLYQTSQELLSPLFSANTN